MFLASSVTAFMRETRRIKYLDDGDIVTITPAGATFMRPDGERDREGDRRGRLGRRGRREGRLRDVHAQGDLRAAGRRRGDDRRPRPPREARARRARPHRPRDPEPAPDRDPLLRHLVPRGRRRPVRDRGVGADSGRARHRERVEVPQPRALEGHARDRDLAVGRDARHDRGDPAREGVGRAHARDHEHDGDADRARGRLRPLHARRPRDGGRLLEDVHRAGRAALPDRAEARAGAADASRGRDRLAARRGARPPRQDPGVPRRRAIRSRRSPSATTTSRSSSTSAATSGCPSASRAR